MLTFSPNTARGFCAVLQRGDQAALEQVERLGRHVRRREREVIELQRGLEIVRRGVAADPLGVVADARRRRCDLARQHLAEVDRVEPAHAADADQRRCELGALEVRFGRQRRAAGRVGAEQHLIVLEVGGLEPHLDAVRQRQHRGANLRDGAAARHLAAGGRILHQRRGRRSLPPRAPPARCGARDRRLQAVGRRRRRCPSSPAPRPGPRGSRR